MSPVLFLIAAGPALAAPITVHHQARLLEASGAPIQGARDLVIELRDADTGGALLFTEAFPGVPVVDGHLSLVLGEGSTPLDSAVFRGDVWVVVRVDGAEVGRTPLHAVPLAGNLSGGIALHPDGTRTWRDGTLAPSCAAYRSGGGGHSYTGDVGDGVYRIQPGLVAYDVVCDMSTDGGGWTLLLKATGAGTLSYGSALWTNTTLLAETDLDTDAGDAKFRSFIDLPVTRLRACLGEPGAGCFTAGLPATGTALAQFQGGARVFAVGDAALSLTHQEWALQPNCRQLVLNRGGNYVRVRFGFTANNEADCSSNDTAVGLGTDHITNGTWNHGAGLVWQACPCYTLVGSSPAAQDVGTNGWLWGR